MWRVAVKFTASGSVSLSCRQVGDQVRVAVADTGIGIAPDDQERIFQKFQQVGEVLSGKPKGTGPGLAICREIVERHAGRLWVESEPGRGSTSTCSVPVLRQAELSTAASRPQAARRGRPSRAAPTGYPRWSLMAARDVLPQC
jgi:signal transduction histidine kinase